MRRLSAFVQVTLDGFFADSKGDMSWAHKPRDDAEWNAFVEGNASSSGTLLFGRVTYDLMASYWPTPPAMKNDPVVAEGMNRMPKVVFSRTMDKASWSNTKLIKGDLATEVRKLKQESGSDMAILGSGSIVSQLTDVGLIDDLQIVVQPLLLGNGKPLFAGLKNRLHLKVTRTKAFANGCVLLCYAPAS